MNWLETPQIRRHLSRGKTGIQRRPLHIPQGHHHHRNPTTPDEACGRTARLGSSETSISSLCDGATTPRRGKCKTHAQFTSRTEESECKKIVQRVHYTYACRQPYGYELTRRRTAGTESTWREEGLRHIKRRNQTVTATERREEEEGTKDSSKKPKTEQW